MFSHRHLFANSPFICTQSRLRAACLLVAACAVSPAALLAAENPGAHEHGHARLQMALESNRIDVMFTSPAHNLAGFEYEARTEEEKNQLAEIRHWLEKTPLINTANNTCKVAGTTVKLGGTKETHGDHGEEHDHDKEHDHSDEATHREYEVSQQLDCGSIADDAAFTSPLMAEYTELRELKIEWVSQSGQGSVEMTTPDMTFSANN